MDWEAETGGKHKEVPFASVRVLTYYYERDEADTNAGSRMVWKSSRVPLQAQHAQSST